MKKTLLTAAVVSAALFANAQTELTVQVDSKLMFNVDCNLLGDGAGGPAQVNNLYMHSGACSENRGSNQSLTASEYCIEQIIPFASDVWQHVVGNWGGNPQDDGVGEMTHVGDGVYEITFVVEDYYSDPTLVNGETNSTGTTQSTLLDPTNPVHVLGMVFRNEDATATGRDQQGCNDIFVVGFAGNNPQVINSTDFSTCDYVKIIKDDVGIEDRALVNRISVGPNPANEFINFALNMKQPVQNVGLVLINPLGQNVYSQRSDLNFGQNNLSVNVSELPTGIYIASFVSDAGIIAQERVFVVR